MRVVNTAEHARTTAYVSERSVPRLPAGSPWTDADKAQPAKESLEDA